MTAVRQPVRDTSLVHDTSARRACISSSRIAQLIDSISVGLLPITQRPRLLIRTESGEFIYALSLDATRVRTSKEGRVSPSVLRVRDGYLITASAIFHALCSPLPILPRYKSALGLIKIHSSHFMACLSLTRATSDSDKLEEEFYAGRADLTVGR